MKFCKIYPLAARVCLAWMRLSLNGLAIEIVSVAVGDKTSDLVVEGISASELFDGGMSSSLTNVMKFVKRF